jgi:hypothetical protein
MSYSHSFERLQASDAAPQLVQWLSLQPTPERQLRVLL